MALGRWQSNAPRLVHITSAESWDAIRQLGLRPATWLVDRAQSLGEEQRLALVEQRRDTSVWMDVDGLKVRLRDQEPLSPSWSRHVVEDEDPVEYLRTLNSCVFMFPTTADLDGPGLKKFRSKYVDDKLLLVFDTASLMERLSLYGKVQLVDGNPGATSYNPSERHLTLKKLMTPSGWLKQHPNGRIPQEVLIRDGLAPDLMNELLVDVHLSER